MSPDASIIPLRRLTGRAESKSIGERSVFYKPLVIRHPRYVRIGALAGISGGAGSKIVLRTKVHRAPRLTIGNYVNIERGTDIICQCRIAIEDELAITPYCVIVDASHPYDNPGRSPTIGGRLDERTDTFVRIGRRTLVGAHCAIPPNVGIGHGCAIGAGSLVTRGIADHALAVGAPARVARRFNLVSRAW